MPEPLRVAIFSSKILLKHKLLAFLRDFDLRYRKILNFSYSGLLSNHMISSAISDK